MDKNGQNRLLKVHSLRGSPVAKGSMASKALLILLLPVLVTSSQEEKTHVKKQPNIVYILVDDAGEHRKSIIQRFDNGLALHLDFKLLYPLSEVGFLCCSVMDLDSSMSKVLFTLFTSHFPILNSNTKIRQT